MFAIGRGGWRKEWKVNGPQRVGTHGGDRAGTWSCAFFRVMLTWDCAVMPLSAPSPVILSAPLSFLEAIGGAITQKADTSAILSTLCPLHVRFVILQQGQGISSDRCLCVLRVLTRSNLSMGFCFTGQVIKYSLPKVIQTHGIFQIGKNFQRSSTST